MLFAKVGAIGALGVGCIITYKCVSVQDSWMPGSETLKSLDSPDGKYLKDMHQYFVDADLDKNEQWWTWSFNYRWVVDKGAKTEMGSSFQSVTGLDGFKGVCKDLYSKTDAELNDQNKTSLWRYCSVLGSIPKSISQSDHLLENKYREEPSQDPALWGKKKSSDLISTYDEANKLFWQIKEGLFFGDLGKYDSASKNEEGKKTVFDKLYDSKDVNRSGRSLRDACRVVYETSSSDSGDGKVTEEELVRYCGYKNTPRAVANQAS